MNFLESLQNGLSEAFEENERVVLMGEDIRDPYGGAFKVSRGLSTRFPDRVINTPISEAGFTGVAGGMAIRGLRPVVEIMFGDFNIVHRSDRQSYYQICFNVSRG